MKISLVIPTRNRALLLKNALESVLKQTIDQNEFEVIVVDNGSTDATKEICIQYEKKIKNLIYFFEPTPGLHVGRHKGLKESRSDILVFIDDDIELFPQHLETVLESFEDEQVVLVGGKNLPKYEEAPPKWIIDIWNRDATRKFIWSLSILDFGNNRMELDANYVFGCNFSIRKKILFETQGFHPDGMPEDMQKYRGDGETYVARYVNGNSSYKTIYNPLASIYHYVPKSRLTKGYFCKRNYEKGISDAFTDIRNKKEIEVIEKLIVSLKTDSSIFSRYYLKGYLFLLHHSEQDKRIFDWINREHYL